MMADALNNARDTMDFVLASIKDEHTKLDAMEAMTMAQAYAAIAQAEQLKRIADMMDIDQSYKMRKGEYGYGT